MITKLQGAFADVKVYAFSTLQRELNERRETTFCFCSCTRISLRACGCWKNGHSYIIEVILELCTMFLWTGNPCVEKLNNSKSLSSFLPIWCSLYLYFFVVHRLTAQTSDLSNHCTFTSLAWTKGLPQEDFQAYCIYSIKERKQKVGDEKTDTLLLKRGVRAQCAQIKFYIHLHKYKLRGFVTGNIHASQIWQLLWWEECWHGDELTFSTGVGESRMLSWPG